MSNVLQSPNNDDWNSLTVNGFENLAERVVLSSKAISNTSDKNSIEVTLKYEEITPDGENALVGFLLQGVIEKEVAPGVWTPICEQFDVVKGTDEAQTQIIELSPTLNLDPGIPEFYSVGSLNQDVAISRTNGRAPKDDAIRVCILAIRTDETRDDLTSLVISGFYDLFDK